MKEGYSADTLEIILEIDEFYFHAFVISNQHFPESMLSSIHLRWLVILEYTPAVLTAAQPLPLLTIPTRTAF